MLDGALLSVLATARAAGTADRARLLLIPHIETHDYVFPPSSPCSSTCLMFCTPEMHISLFNLCKTVLAEEETVRFACFPPGMHALGDVRCTECTARVATVVLLVLA